VETEMDEGGLRHGPYFTEFAGGPRWQFVLLEAPP